MPSSATSCPSTIRSTRSRSFRAVVRSASRCTCRRKIATACPARALESQIASLFGGRIAEEMINGVDGVTTGASNDIERATEIARNMVTKWGLSDRLGPLTYSEDDGEVFLGRSVTQHKQVSDDTAHAIDEEVRRIIDRNYDRAEKLLDENLDKLHTMAKALIKYETIDEEQIKDIMEGREPQPPEDWDDSGPNRNRLVGTPKSGRALGGKSADRPRSIESFGALPNVAPHCFDAHAIGSRHEFDIPMPSWGYSTLRPIHFSDGGRFHAGLDAALRQAAAMAEEGAASSMSAASRRGRAPGTSAGAGRARARHCRSLRL